MVVLTSMPATSLSGWAKATSRTQPPGPQAMSRTWDNATVPGSPARGPPMPLVVRRSKLIKRAISAALSGSRKYPLVWGSDASCDMASFLVYALSQETLMQIFLSIQAFPSPRKMLLLPYQRVSSSCLHPQRRAQSSPDQRREDTQSTLEGEKNGRPAPGNEWS